MSLDKSAFQELFDKQACQDLLARYVYALEWVDEEALRKVFYPDAEIDYGYFKGRGDEFIPLIVGLVSGYTRTWHNNGAALLKINGDTAEAETHGTGATVSERDGKVITNLLGGRYFDRLERREGEWGIARRVYVVDWMHLIEADAEEEAELGLNRLAEPSTLHPLYRPL